VSDDRLPVETEPPISEDLRQREIDVLQGLVASGKVDLDRFQTALDGLLAARTHAEFAAVVRGLPPPVEFLRPRGGVKSAGDFHLDGRDSPQGPLAGRSGSSSTPPWARSPSSLLGADVRQVGSSGAVNSTLEPPTPGFPVVRLSASSDMGTIRLKQPKQKSQRRWGSRRRRSQATPRS
jgi:Domain of unknown function (DUF1707)